MSDNVRRPAVAGQFYEAGRAGLLAEIEDAYLGERGPGALPVVDEQGPRRLIGLVSPHAGYVYSAPMAAYGFSALAADGHPKTCVVIGPNHGRGSWVSAIQTEGAWLTPLGEAQIDTEVASAIAQELPWLEQGPEAFRGEHSLEVQIPFLQHLYADSLRIVPIMMLEQDQKAATAIGEALGRVLQGHDAVIIASTDMTHQEPRQVAGAQDRLLAERIAALDAEGLLRERQSRDITMCGYGPVAAMIVAARSLGATRGEILRYGDSGEAHPMATVVGYLCAAIYRD
jgi:AmmeMemoRadiSam system protein B